ncbi:MULTISPECIES: squalene--hopene cyclase [Planktothrix]|jgi:squalene-hopene/tetraprenyl-beta-curcumene cyclase|uniref:Squalene--hopene cyclase n=2 Tax=Planktothrix TaxID=54304 RepID=A0A6J7ZSV0_PLARU|nr:squalene--hopene cyclase [Planktothrix agardhii]CAC5345440.1 Squalene--hopene cyclase [Planktothrix rubescens NIVA-CYA 18]CAD5958863.1 Dammaradiene synthase [Planktothrix rubescens NIVA-CYA 18]
MISSKTIAGVKQITMEIENQVSVNQLKDAIAASQNFLFSQQYPEGYWWAELQSNVTIISEVILLHKIWGTDKTRPLYKAETYLRSQQRDHGGWELFYGDGGELSTTVEAYMALKILGVSETDSALIKAKQFILEQGGITKTRIFTKLHLALIGCYDWRGIPSIPPWIMLLPEGSPFTIYEMSSWARSSTVPLLIVFDKKPVFRFNSSLNLDELYVEGRENAIFELPKNNDWTDIFLGLDQIFKFAELFNVVPLREQGLKAAEKWILERQEITGDWAGIIPAMLNSLLALKCLNYPVSDPIVQRGLEAIDNFAIETEESYRMQACVSPVWDTAWVVRALIESGIDPNNADIVKSSKWLIRQQILDYGDWNIKNKQGKPGGWAFEFANKFYPDLDDSAVVVMALNQAKITDEPLKTATIIRGIDWMISMQCKAGGWAAFDIDNDQDWINAVPYGDLKAMIDPNTADVTARVIEMLGELDPNSSEFQLKIQSLKPSIERAISYLKQEQETDGSWFGRWGVNYIYGTSGVLSALAVINPIYKNWGYTSLNPLMERGTNWLVSCQNIDGGWGETCHSYNDTKLKGKGVSTASQTAWALIGLMATGCYEMEVIQRGINYLISIQLSDGRWDESEFTGTGFPGHFYIKYHYYQHYFPLLALGRYQKLQQL